MTSAKRRIEFIKLSGFDDYDWDDHQIALWLALHKVFDQQLPFRHQIQQIQDELDRLDHAVVHKDEIDGG